MWVCVGGSGQWPVVKRVGEGGGGLGQGALEREPHTKLLWALGTGGRGASSLLSATLVRVGQATTPATCTWILAMAPQIPQRLPVPRHQKMCCAREAPLPPALSDPDLPRPLHPQRVKPDKGGEGG